MSVLGLLMSSSPYLRSALGGGTLSKLRDRPEYQVSSGTKYKYVIQCDSHGHYLDIDTIQ